MSGHLSRRKCLLGIDVPSVTGTDTQRFIGVIFLCSSLQAVVSLSLTPPVDSTTASIKLQNGNGNEKACPIDKFLIEVNKARSRWIL